MKPVLMWGLFNSKGKLDRISFYKTRREARIAATGGEDDIKWWRGCMKNGYSLKRVQVTLAR